MTQTELLSLPALSVRAPWAWLIVMGFKTWENRDWKPPYRDRLVLENRAPFRCLIHASGTLTKQDYTDALALVELINVHRLMCSLAPIELPSYGQIQALRGHLIGAAMLNGFQTARKPANPWSTGPGIPLTEPEVICPVPCKGRLGFFYPRLPSN
jgi:hypothetical protein